MRHVRRSSAHIGPSGLLTAGSLLLLAAIGCTIRQAADPPPASPVAVGALTPDAPGPTVYAPAPTTQTVSAPAATNTSTSTPAGPVSEAPSVPIRRAAPAGYASAPPARGGYASAPAATNIASAPAAANVATAPPVDDNQPVVVNTPPPQPRAETMSPQPVSNSVWVPGHWTWRSNWVWTSGTWRVPPPGYRRWVSGRWEQTGSSWRWVPGYWM